MLDEMLRRVLRRPTGWQLLALHLSVLAPPRGYHLRIARAVLQEAALRHDGQVFSLADGDMVLLCRVSAVDDTAALGEMLLHLFQADAPDGGCLLSIWRLERDGDAARHYAASRLATAPLIRSPAQDAAGDPQALAAVEATVRGIRFADLMRRQTAVRLEPSRGSEHSRLPPVQPLYRELSISVAALERRIPAARHARADPFLFRHLVSGLDELVLQALLGDLPVEAGLLSLEPDCELPLHLNLSVAGILSAGFTRLLQQRSAGLGPLAVEVALLDACADPHGFVRASERLRQAGVGLILDGIGQATLLLVSPAALQPDLMKLDWSPRLLRMPPADRKRIEEALSNIDPARLVLDHADSDAALRWGQAHGIYNFQGRYVDMLQARTRRARCPQGWRCTLDQCAGRAAATDLATRATCHDRAVLDASGQAPLFGPPLSSSPLFGSR
jgi:hypothetical protein